MKTISIIEFFYHAEVLRETVLLLQHPQIQIQIFTTDKVLKNSGLKEMSLNQTTFFTKSNQFSIMAFFKENRGALEKSHLTIINTLAYHIRHFFILREMSKVIILRIHNSNRWFERLKKNYRFKPTPFFIWKDFSYVIREGIFYGDLFLKRQFLQQINYFAFSSDNLKEYAVKNLHVNPDNALVLPFSFLSGLKEPQNIEENDSVHFAIIGAIDFRKRDYELIYQIFSEMDFTNARSTVRLYLAGPSHTSHGKEMVRKFRAIQKNNFEVIDFKDFVPQSEMEEMLAKMDFILSPTNVDARFRIYSEEYGKTKLSGIMGDILKYRKTSILPLALEIDEEYKKVTYQYRDKAHLKELLLMMILDKNRYKKSFDEMQSYTYDQVRSKLFNELSFLEIH